jgi:hypothetical protein
LCFGCGVFTEGQEPVFTKLWGKVVNYADARKLAQLMLKDHRLPTLPGPGVLRGGRRLSQLVGTGFTAECCSRIPI